MTDDARHADQEEDQQRDHLALGARSSRPSRRRAAEGSPTGARSVIARVAGEA
jgi:hypothetical protein